MTGNRSKTKLTPEQQNAQKLASKRWSLIEDLLVEIDRIVTSNVSRTSLNKTRLKQVGFTEEFINEMDPAVLNHFVNADAYMAKGMWEKGQEELDKITEPELANKKANRFKHPTIWSGDAIWISRNKQDYIVASRMLLAYHIGKHKGTYGRVVRGESSEDELGRAGESVVYARDVSPDLTFDKMRREANRQRAAAKVVASRFDIGGGASYSDLHNSLSPTRHQDEQCLMGLEDRQRKRCEERSLQERIQGRGVVGRTGTARAEEDAP